MTETTSTDAAVCSLEGCDQKRKAKGYCQRQAYEAARKEAQ